MSYLEKIVLLILSAVSVSSYWIVPYFYRLAKVANSSFMAKLYMTPVILCFAGILLLILFILAMLDQYSKK